MKTFQLIFLTCLSCFLSLNIVEAQLYINEFVAANTEGLLDEDGESSDWLELYNPGESAISLASFYLSDDVNEPQKWALPFGTLEAGEFLLVFCSGKDRSAFGQPLHSNFRIGASGESLILTRENESIQQIAPVALDEDISYAAFPLGGGVFLPTENTTPGAPNLLNAGPDFTHLAGFYDTSFSLGLGSDDLDYDELEIRYTLNGDEPGPHATIYESAFTVADRSATENVFASIPGTPDFSNWTGEGNYPEWMAPEEAISKGTVVRSAYFQGGRKISPIATSTFFVYPEGEDRYSLPVVLLTCPPDSLFSDERGIYVPGDSLEDDNLIWSGNYFNTGADWERTSSMEYFEHGERVIDQTIGVRIHGGKTRGAAQKSLRLYARSHYGDKEFNHRFFPGKAQDSYKRLVLRTTMGAWTGTVFADAFTHQAARELNFDVQEYQPVIVFLNGEYWGVYELRERFDEHKIAADHDIDKDSITIFGSYGRVINDAEPDGMWVYLRDLFLPENDLADPGVYERLVQHIDLDNLIDYTLTEIYFNNRDWPGNNSKMWRSEALDNKFRWMYFDLDAAMGYERIDENKLAEILGEEGTDEIGRWANAMIRALLRNEEFKTRFLERAEFLLQEAFDPERLRSLAFQMVDQYEGEMDEHFARWGGWSSKVIWREKVRKHISSFVLQRGCVMESQMMEFFGIESFLDCERNDPWEVQNTVNAHNGTISDDEAAFIEEVEEEAEPKPENELLSGLVYNSLGQFVAEVKITRYSNGLISSLKLSGLPAGMYVVVVLDEQGNRTSTKQMVKF